MKLCHVVPSLEEQHGGPSKSVRALCTAFARGGHEINLFATAPGATRDGTIDAGGLKTTVFRRDWPQRLCCSAGLRRALESCNSEVIHHHALWLRTVHYAHRNSAEKGATFVVSPRGMMSRWAWGHHASRKRLAEWFVHPGALNAVDGWHATSAEEEREIRALGFEQPVCVAANGIDPIDATTTREAMAYWHELCPETKTRPVALFYSRFHRKKRVLELVDLWLAQGPTDWLLLLVGIPEDYTAESVERHARRVSEGGRVRAFNGIGRPPPYGIASLFLLPSHNENFGMVVAEAMAHAVPAIVTDTTPWRQLRQLELGWCVPWSEFSLALATATAMRVTELRERGARARAWVLREFSWDDSARRLAEFYSALRAPSR